MARGSRGTTWPTPGRRARSAATAPVRASQPAESCGTITIASPQFDQNNVVLTSCHLNNGQSLQPGSGSVPGSHTWQNDHQDSANSAFVRAEVHVGGTAVPIQVDTGPQHRRQASATAYESMVPAGQSATVGYTVQAADLPTGQNLPVEIVPSTIERRSLDAF